MCGIDAVGYEAETDDDPSKQRPTQIIEDLVRAVNPTGRLGIIGVYFKQDPGGVDEEAKQGVFRRPLASSGIRA
jgi:glutathione-independent formaldehyde dehydrogenase